MVIDHRSTDGTRDLVAGLRSRFRERGVELRYEYEGRDFSRHFNFGDLWTRAIRSCSNDLVCWLDADFLLGPGFETATRQAVSMLRGQARPFGVSFEVPQLAEDVSIDAEGTLVSHGRWRMHAPRPRFVRRDAVAFRLHDNRFEKAFAREPEAGGRQAPLIELPPSSLVSIDVKTPEQQRLRRTMTVFQKWAIESRSDLCWLEAFESGALDGLDFPRRPDTWISRPRYVGQRFYVRRYRSP